MAIVATLKGTISITDNITGSVALSKPVNNAYSGTVESYGQSVIVGTTSSTITLPGSPAEFIYIKNLSTTSGTNLTVTWTPEGGSSANVITLDPGALMVVTEVTLVNGISALSLISNQSGTPVEYILIS